MADEAIDQRNLEAWFASEIDGAQPPLEFERISGGRSNLTYGVTDSGGRRWALRRPPLGKRLASAHDMGREHRIIAALAGTDVPVAPAVALCEDESVNGAPFYVMDFVEGPILRTKAEAEVSFGEADRKAIGERVVDTLVAIHAVDPDEAGVGDLGRKEDYVARQLRRWHGQWEKSKTRELEVIDDVHRRLSERIPEQGPATIVHGDYRLDNLILSADGEIAAVVDWELCTLGDPLADVGMLLVYWSQPGDELMPLFDPPTTAAGFPLRADVRRAVRRASPGGTSPRSTTTSRSRSGSSRSSSRESSPATRRASTARTRRATSSSPRWSSGSLRARTRPSDGCARRTAAQAFAVAASRAASADPAPSEAPSSSFAQ